MTLPPGSGVDTWTPGRLHFKAVTEATSLIAWATEVDGHCFYFSPEWYRFTGLAEGESLGFNWLMAIHPDDVVAVRQAFFAANDSCSAYGIAYRLRRPDESYSLVWAVGFPKLNDEGVFQGFFGTSFPIQQADYSGLRSMASNYGGTRKLSEREREVMVLIAEGHTSEAVAQKLGITRRTVETHVANVGEKLGGLNRVHTVTLAVRFNEI